MRLLDLLSGGDRRSIGRADEVVARILKHPKEFGSVFEGLAHADEVVRMRAADVVEKVSRIRPELVRPYKKRILQDIANTEQPEVQWHVAQMIPRLELTRHERKRAVAILLAYCSMKSRILRTFALQALFSLAANDPTIRGKVSETALKFAESGSPAMKTRAKQILQQLKQGLPTPPSKS